MAEDDVFIREVDEDLAQARQLATLRKYAPFFIAVILGVMGAISGREFLQNRHETIAQESAVAYADAMANDDPAGARLAFEALYENGPTGYGTLAALHVASMLAQKGEREAAIVMLTDLAADTTRAVHLRNLAKLRAGYLSVADGTSAVSAILNGLELEETAFGYHAKEALALAALQEKDFTSALALFRQLESVGGGPQSIRDRAAELGATAYLGTKDITPSVAVEGDSSVDDMFADHAANDVETDELTEHDKEQE